VTTEPFAAATPAEAQDRPGPEQPGRRWLPDWRPAVVPLLLLGFVGLAFWMYLPTWSSPTTTTLRGGNGDPAIFIFFLR
jgi:hypothetical protein